MGIILIRSVINLKNNNRIKIIYKNDFERIIEIINTNKQIGGFYEKRYYSITFNK